MSRARTRHERLRWDAAVIDTGAAEPFALDNRHLHSSVCQPNCKRRSCLASANNDRVIFSCHGDTSLRTRSKKEKVRRKEKTSWSCLENQAFLRSWVFWGEQALSVWALAGLDEHSPY